MSECVLAEQTHAFIRQHPWETVVLPFGATEPHNYHMPYGTDTFQVEVVGRKACDWAYERGARVLLLPAIPFGVNTNHLQIPGGMALSVTPTTLLKILTDLVDSLERQGVKKLVLLNGHGGNELKPLLRELFHRTKMFMCICDWYKLAQDHYQALFEQPGEHADEVETSLGLAYFPDFMHMELAGPGSERPSRFEAINKGWISVTRPWHIVSVDTGIGNPEAAFAAKGKRLMAILEERLGDFLLQLATTPVDERFPY